MLSFIEKGASREEAEMCVILMHGLGADGHDFADVAQILAEAALPEKWRFILPHAPQMPVTINMGMTMPAWYDILDMSQPRRVDWASVDQSQVEIEALISQESAAKVVLAGFSQGGAMALHVGLRTEQKIAGIMAMSGYLLESDDYPCPKQTADFPVGLFHGSADDVVPVTAAEHSKQVLDGAGYTPTLKVYPGLTHAVCDEEIEAIFSWLKGV